MVPTWLNVSFRKGSKSTALNVAALCLIPTVLTTSIKTLTRFSPTRSITFGARSHVAVSFEMPEYTADVDALGRLLLLEAARLLGMEKRIRFYQAGSSEMFGKVASSSQSLWRGKGLRGLDHGKIEAGLGTGDYCAGGSEGGEATCVLKPARTPCREGVDTARSGTFLFQLGLDDAQLETLLLRVSDAQTRFRGSPLASVASQLEKEVVVHSIFGTNSIEGGTLTEEETQAALDLSPSETQDTEQRRAINLKRAYELAQKSVADPDWMLSEAFILSLHTEITQGLPDEYNRPGYIRDNPKNIATHVGDTAHGGRYKPPQYGKDIRTLLSALIQWHEQLKAAGIPALIRAPLVHYYYELIHPFWDGNGRVGRVIEASLLLAEGFRYAPFAMANYYHQNIDHYFALFNTCRKSAAKKRESPNTEFVSFFLEGMLATLHRLHDRVNGLIKVLLFETQLKRLHDDADINTRQYAIVSQLLERGQPINLSHLRKAAWYLGLYASLTDKTKQRDLKRLIDAKLIIKDKEERLWPGFVDVEY
ncbi:unnamed protein product [Cyprideis torosa]|uniref:Uncharacterized protein n=1 Tax=Cyprideis torosa TaxID=163714 RepID=A0A7R8WP85_9CRUS|nr:unnamed protein product [Cyprideis torosa]CAG0906717.1 unnamed protein product [Cyprideis torosa]